MEHSNTILIVDDESSACETLKALLFKQRYNLAFAGNGIEALTKAEELTPDVILLDVMMPDMDGFEVCRRLRANPNLAEVPIIMVTALDDRASRLQGIEAGADDFISKPFDRIELRARIRSITRLNRYRRLLLERGYRHQAEQAVHRRNYELTLLNQVITTAATTLNLQDVLYVACEALAKIFEIPRATAVLLNQDQTHFTTTVEYRAPWASLESEQPPEIIQEIPLVGHLSVPDLSASKAPWAVIAGQIEPQLAQIQTLMAEYGLGSLLLVPIFMNDQFMGSIELKAIEQHEFSSQDMTLAQSIATAIGQAMETIQLYQNLQRHAEELEEMVTHQPDITNHKETERHKDRFVVNVSHELRPTLSIITRLVSNLDTFYECLTDDTQRAMIQTMGEDLQGLKAHIDGVLKMPHLTNEHIPHQQRRVDIDPIDS